MDVMQLEIYRETDIKGTATPALVLRAKGKDAGGLFNPREIAVAKTVTWRDQGGRRRDQPRVSFDGGASRTLTLSLLLDTYEAADRDVRVHTVKLAELARYDGDLHRPPVVRVHWGPDRQNADLPFRGVVTSLTQKFTLFLPDGTPVRATVDMTLKEYKPSLREEQERPSSSPDRRKFRTVRAGDTLWAIAYAEYDNASQWRPIATANDIDDPRRLPIGEQIVIPALEP